MTTSNAERRDAEASHRGRGAGPGPLNLVKLCVGAENLEDLEIWQAARLSERAAAGLGPRLWHRTRMTPKRAEELLAGGSLYWVIKGRIVVRQRLLAIEPAADARAVDLVLDPPLIRTAPQPRRPFQGWRYLEAADAPADALNSDADKADAAELPSVLREAVAEYGVL